MLKWSDIRVQDVRSGTVYLEGTAKTKDEKLLAESVARHVPGVKHVEDKVAVNSSTGSSNTR